MPTDEPIHFTATLTELEGPMFGAAIRIPAQVAKIFRKSKGAIRILCSIEGQTEFPCALNPRADDYIIIVSKALKKQHKLVSQLPFRISIRLDPQNGLLLPEELEEVLNQDEWGRRLFEALLPGRKRGYIYYVRTAKGMDTRIKRSFEIMEKLKLGNR